VKQETSMMRTHQCRAVTRDQATGRLVYTVEELATGHRLRVYNRNGRWRYFAAEWGDRLVNQQVGAAVNRYLEVLRGEREAQLSLYPAHSREVRATSPRPPATVAASPTPVPGAAAGVSS
jgi:hypothetical protein